MAQYQHLNLTEREELSRALAAGWSRRAIARHLGRAPSTISRELRRAGMTPVTYRAAPVEAARRLHPPRRGRKLVTRPALQTVVHGLLQQRWSPEQIAKRLILAYPADLTMRVSHETIYTYLYVLPRGALKRTLLAALRQERTRRRHRRAGPDHRGLIPDMLSIEERPAEVADRTVPGHWEGDLLMGRRNASAVGTLVERTTRLVLLVPLAAKDAGSVRQAFAEALRTLPPSLTRSLTYDQGKEMAEHRLFTQATQIQVYFAHPHSPWERGTNENTNGLLRQFFPKGTDFARVARHDITHVQDLLNGRPRKVLQWRTPSEAFQELLQTPVALGT